MNTIIKIAQEFVFTRNTYKRKEFWYMLQKGLAYLFRYMPLTWYYRRTKKQELFKFYGNEYHYHYGLYNATWRNERAVELPIAQALLWQWRGSRVLEVGNVLEHYFVRRHDVLDKYERGRGIIREDIADFKPQVKYDCVISISTLEHIGWDETPRQPEKLLEAINNLKGNVIKLGGEMIVTLPLGYNAYLDNLLVKSELPFEDIKCLMRVSHNNLDWYEVDWSPAKVGRAEYREGYGTTVMVVATIRGE